MLISAIAAIDKKNAIGKNNDLPWHLPLDFRHFKKTTTGHYVVTGRRNFESIGRLLSNRPHLILSRQADFTVEGAQIVRSIESAIQIAKNAGESELFIIGGGEIYTLAMPHVDRLYMTEVDTVVENPDVFFPEINPSEWTEKSRVVHPADEKHKYGFSIVQYDRTQAAL